MKNLLTGLIVLLYSSVCFAGELNVTGNGSVAMPPDMANAMVAVVNTAQSPSSALKANNESSNAVIESLIKAGLKREEIRTKLFDLSPQWRYVKDKEPDLVGYKVTHMLEVTVCDLKQLGNVIDTAVSSGANKVEKVEFGLSPDRLKRALGDARVEAAKDAANKASLYANALGLKVRSLKTLTEVLHSYRNSDVVLESAYRSNDRTNIVSGSIEIKAQVQTSWNVD